MLSTVSSMSIFGTWQGNFWRILVVWLFGFKYVTNDDDLSVGIDEADFLSPLVCQIKSIVDWHIPTSSNGRCDDAWWRWSGRSCWWGDVTAWVELVMRLEFFTAWIRKGLPLVLHTLVIRMEGIAQAWYIFWCRLPDWHETPTRLFGTRLHW